MDFLTDSGIDALLQEQNKFFSSQQTKAISFRRDALKRLLASCLKYEENILKALHQDLNKSNEEAYLTEFSLVNRNAF